MNPFAIVKYENHFLTIWLEILDICIKLSQGEVNR